MSANIERQHSSEYAALTPARRIRPAYKGINVNKAPDSRFFDPVTESQDVQTSALIAGYRVVQDMDPNADFDIEALSSYKTSEYKDRCLRLTPAQQAEEAAKKKQEAKEARHLKYEVVANYDYDTSDDESEGCTQCFNELAAEHWAQQFADWDEELSEKEE